MEHYEKIGDGNKRLKGKLRDLKDRSRRIIYVLMGWENMRMNYGMLRKKF